jgi:hypothetical protein
MRYKYEDILLLRSAPVALFEEKLTEQQAKKLIESNIQKKIALQFFMDDSKSKETSNYIVYFDESKHYFIQAIAVYILLYILFLYFSKINSMEIKRFRCFRSIRAMLITIYLSAILVWSGTASAITWIRNRSNLSELLTKEIHFIQSKNNQNYTLIIKGE